MSKVNWQQVGTDVETAVKNVLGGAWQNVSGSAGPQIQALASVAQNIEKKYENNKLSEDEYKSLRAMQKNALEGILSSDRAIGIVVAEQAADAAWTVVSSALLKGAGIPFA
jgi:hypothetical protein